MENSLKIMDMPKNERPQEKLLRYGAEVLTNPELLAVILRTGTKGCNVTELSSIVLNKFGGLNGLFDSVPEDYMKIDGIGKTKAAQLTAIIEIAKRLRSFKSGSKFRISKPEDVSGLLMEEMKCLKEEHLRVIMLNTKNVVIHIKDISIGSLNSSIVHPREVFCEAIKRSSASIIICHNHPSGDPLPSSEDINITRRLKECSKLIGIDLIDHIIIGNGVYVSLKEKGIL